LSYIRCYGKWSEVALAVRATVDNTECLFAGWSYDVAFRHRTVLIAFLYTLQRKQRSFVSVTTDVQETQPVVCLGLHGYLYIAVSKSPPVFLLCVVRLLNVVYVSEPATRICGTPAKRTFLKILHEILAHCSASFQWFYVHAWT
jgi:hypothetical protein